MRKWMASNMLKVNDQKTELIVFTPKHKKLDQITIQVGEANIQSVPWVRDLGATLDSHMTMERQVNALCSSAYYHLRNISRIRSHLNETATRSLVQALVISRIDYCNSLLHGLPKRMLSKLQRVQNSAARIVAKSTRRQHITPVLQDLHWLPIEYRIQYKILMLTFKALHSEAPMYIQELLEERRSVRALRSNDALLLQVPRMKTSRFGERAFISAAPTLWNKLPAYIRKIDSISGFKKDLKTYFFSKAYLIN